MPKISVITPVYNIAEHLPRFFDSMLAQSFSDFKLLIFDDGSVDDSISICEKYAHKDHRISVFKLEHGGVTKTRNTALDYVDSEFIVFADGDDYVEPNYLKHLIDAQKKYNADLVVSRVQYELEDGTVEGSFRERGELVLKKTVFNDNLPMLLDDRRLNYLYGKIYRSELLKGIRVDDDVRQGSDTMINIQFVNVASSIVLIDDLDYHYIRYSSRSVTSYAGEDAYLRICRINKFVYDYCNENDMMTDRLLFVIDSRVLQSAGWVIDKIFVSNSSKKVKSEQITKILNNKIYLDSYNRQLKNSAGLVFEIIKPQSGSDYIKSRNKAIKSNQRKAKILSKCPLFIVNLYHKIKGVP